LITALPLCALYRCAASAFYRACSLHASAGVYVSAVSRYGERFILRVAGLTTLRRAHTHGMLFTATHICQAFVFCWMSGWAFIVILPQPRDIAELRFSRYYSPFLLPFHSGQRQFSCGFFLRTTVFFSVLGSAVCSLCAGVFRTRWRVTPSMATAALPLLPRGDATRRSCHQRWRFRFVRASTGTPCRPCCPIRVEQDGTILPY